MQGVDRVKNCVQVVLRPLLLTMNQPDKSPVWAERPKNNPVGNSTPN